MNLFDKDPAKRETPAQDDNQEHDYVALLKEKGRPVDLVSLAKKAIHSDEHIQSLEATLAELREDLGKRLTYEQLQTEIKALRQTGESNPAHKAPEETPESKQAQLSAGDIENIVREALTKETASQKASRHVSEVKQALTDAWGASYVSKLEVKAKELGMEQPELEALAASNPKAFLKLVDVTATQKSDPGVPVSRVNSGALPHSSGGKNKAYFDNIKKNDPKAYWSPKVQSELHRNAIALGDAFYK